MTCAQSGRRGTAPPGTAARPAAWTSRSRPTPACRTPGSTRSACTSRSWSTPARRCGPRRGDTRTPTSVARPGTEGAEPVSSSDYGQVTTVVQRLGDLLSLLNPVKLVMVVAEVIKEIAVPPPGDPGALDNLAAAYRAAADAVRPIAADVGKVGTDHLPEAWKGGAATDAAAVITALGKAVDRTPQAFTDAADALTELAGAVRDQQ